MSSTAEKSQITREVFTVEKNELTPEQKDRKSLILMGIKKPQDAAEFTRQDEDAAIEWLTKIQEGEIQNAHTGDQIDKIELFTEASTAYHTLIDVAENIRLGKNQHVSKIQERRLALIKVVHDIEEGKPVQPAMKHAVTMSNTDISNAITVLKNPNKAENAINLMREGLKTHGKEKKAKEYAQNYRDFLMLTYPGQTRMWDQWKTLKKELEQVETII